MVKVVHDNSAMYYQVVINNVIIGKTNCVEVRGIQGERKKILIDIYSSNPFALRGITYLRRYILLFRERVRYLPEIL